jgi:hypothetical protein
MEKVRSAIEIDHKNRIDRIDAIPSRDGIYMIKPSAKFHKKYFNIPINSENLNEIDIRIETEVLKQNTPIDLKYQ